jgi:hypothetical protein
MDLQAHKSNAAVNNVNLSQFCPRSMPSILSTPSMTSEMRPPSGGVAIGASRNHDCSDSKSDFEEITDNGVRLAADAAISEST